MSAAPKEEAPSILRVLSDPAKESHLFAPLAPGWAEHEDADGNLYYHNEETGASVWERPVDPNWRSPASALSPTSVKGAAAAGAAALGGTIESPEQVETRDRMFSVIDREMKKQGRLPKPTGVVKGKFVVEGEEVECTQTTYNYGVGKTKYVTWQIPLKDKHYLVELWHRPDSLNQRKVKINGVKVLSKRSMFEPRKDRHIFDQVEGNFVFGIGLERNGDRYSYSFFMRPKADYEESKKREQQEANAKKGAGADAPAEAGADAGAAAAAAAEAKGDEAEKEESAAQANGANGDDAAAADGDAAKDAGGDEAAPEQPAEAAE